MHVVYHIHARTANVYIERAWPSKVWVKKSCEIKGGGHEIAAMMLTIIHLITHKVLLKFIIINITRNLFFL